MGENLELNPKEAILWFLIAHPDKTPITMWDLDDNRYLLYIEEDGIPAEENHNDPYYVIHKDGFGIFRYSSADDPDLVFAATQKQPVTTRKGDQA